MRWTCIPENPAQDTHEVSSSSASFTNVLVKRFSIAVSPANLIVYPQNLTTKCNCLIYPEEGDFWLSAFNMSLVNTDHDLDLSDSFERVHSDTHLDTVTMSIYNSSSFLWHQMLGLSHNTADSSMISSRIFLQMLWDDLEWCSPCVETCDLHTCTDSDTASCSIGSSVNFYKWHFVS